MSFRRAKSRTGRSLGVVVLASAFAFAARPEGVALAEEPVVADSAAEARQQYELGTQAFSQKRYSEAALHFEAAANVKANAVALYTAALAWDLGARPERAADAYARSLDVPGLDPKLTATVRERIGALEHGLGTLVVTAPEGWKVQLDNFSETSTPARLHAAPGSHALSIQSPGRPVERRDVTLESGRAKTLELVDEPAPVRAVVEAPPPPSEAEPPPPPPVLPPPPPEFWTTRRAVGVGVAGVGLASLAAGVVLGTSANDARDSYVAAPSRAGFDHASSLETWTNAAFIGGALLVAGGVVLVVLPTGDRAGGVRVSAGPGRVVVGGSF